MFRFFFSHIFKNIPRSVSIVISTIIVYMTLAGGWYLYKNTASVIEYYASHGNNEQRVTLAGSSNLLNLFNNESSMDSDTVESIINNPLLTDIQVFRLVDIPVSAKFGFFAFSLESDIPVFSVTDNVLTGATIPVGMSRTMIDLYNTQFAGSSVYFPHMKEDFLQWQSIEFTFGKSKIFQSASLYGTPITGTITTINRDLPGLWLVLPESIVTEKMREIGYKLWAPYKIVAYMTDIEKREILTETYPDLNIIFEIDEIAETKNRITVAAMILILVWCGMIIMMGIFFIFLLSGYFRERKHIFKMVALFGLQSHKSYIMTAGEPIFFSILWILFGTCIMQIFFFSGHYTIASLLERNGILFPVYTLTFSQLLQLSVMLVICFMVVITIFEWYTRRKYSFH